MTDQQLAELSPKMMQWIRKRCGWSRRRLSVFLLRREDANLKFDSVKNLERYETSLLAAPHQSRRYRETLGEDLFDAVLERAPLEAPELFIRQDAGDAEEEPRE